MANEIWLRRSDETPRAYSRFCVYIALPPGERSHEAVAKAAGVSRRQIETLSAKYDWRARAVAYDRHRARREQEIAEDAIAEKAKAEAELWARRRETLRETWWESGCQLADRARQMLAFPLVKVVKREGDKGETITEIHPYRWNANTIPQLMKLALELQMFASGLTTYGMLSEEELAHIQNYEFPEARVRETEFPDSIEP